ncbi:MAG: signal recognition particle subunit SRP19/SEC65 family protein [Thermoproteota archaeon]
MRRSDRVVIHPVYIDSSKTRADGRRVSRAKGVHSPRLSEIVAACSALRFNFIVDENASHPTEPTERRGVVRVIKMGRKTEMLERIAMQIKRSRSEKPEKVKDK